MFDPMPPAPDAELTIGELEQATGVPRRTVYFYVQQGIVPPPRGAGLAARYSSSHLLRLRAIPLLRERGWRLDRIRSYLSERSDAEVAALLDGAVTCEPAVVASPPALPAPAARCETAEASRPGSGPFPQPHALIRYQLAPGIVLLVDDALTSERQPLLQRLLATARALFAGEPPSDEPLETP
jgi:DNA-binding transcriptional MerR regulator